MAPKSRRRPVDGTSPDRPCGAPSARSAWWPG